MRGYSEVVVVAAIVHNVAPKAEDVVVSAAEIDLQSEAVEFLAGHITRGLTDKRAHGARFVRLEADRPAALTAGLLASPETLVFGSQSLARRLHSAMRGDARISGGSLVVALCNASDAGVPVRFVALLKLDPANGFRTVETRRNGSVVLQLGIERNMLPAPKEHLQKAAFISETNAEYDCLVVDQQRAGTSVSDYFMRDFLGAEPALDAPQRTRLLFDALREARNEVAPEMSAQEADRLESSMLGLKSQASVDLDAFVGALRVGEDVKVRIDRVLRQHLPADREFDLDGAVAQARLKRRTMTGDNLLQVSALADQWNNMISVADDPEQPGYRIITIRTRTWREA